MSAATHDHADADARQHSLSRKFGTQRTDPTGTKTLRSQYGSQLYKRWRRVKGAVLEVTVNRDALGLRDQQAPALQQEIPPDDFPQPEEPVQVPLPGISDAFGTTPGTGVDTLAFDMTDYLDWFGSAVDRAVTSPEGWSDEYVTYAYRKGVEDATRRLAQSGVIEEGAGAVELSFDVPIHQSTIKTLLERNNRGLEGVSAATKREVGRILTDGLLEGKNAWDIGDEINDRIDAIGINRARTHAQTVVVGSYNEAALRRYEQAIGDEGDVTVLAEWTTANDDRVCPICLALEGNVYSVREAKGMMPAHPGCRCT